MEGKWTKGLEVGLWLTRISPNSPSIPPNRRQNHRNDPHLQSHWLQPNRPKVSNKRGMESCRYQQTQKNTEYFRKWIRLSPLTRHFATILSPFLYSITQSSCLLKSFVLKKLPREWALIQQWKNLFHLFSVFGKIAIIALRSCRWLQPKPTVSTSRAISNNRTLSSWWQVSWL